MANRVVLGKANDGSSDIYGLFVSKPGVDIINGSGVLCDQEDMLFDSRKGKFAQIFENQDGTGSAQSVTVPAGKRLMFFCNSEVTSSAYDSRTRHYATQTVSSNTMSITVDSGIRYVLMNIEAGDS